MKSSRINIKDIPGDLRTEIDIFVEQNNGLIFHETNFNIIISDFFHTDFSYQIVYDGDQITGVCPVHSVKSNLLKYSYSNPSHFEVPYGGWVYKTPVGFDLVKTIHLQPNESLTYWSSFFNDAGFSNVNNYRKFETGIVQLSDNIENIWSSSVQSKRRNMIRKAQKSGIVIENVTPDRVELFYNLLIEMNQKNKISSKSIDFYRKILQNYSDKKAKILIARLGEDILSGIMLLGNSNVMHYWQGASKTNAENLGQGELLQWEAIQWAKFVNSKNYDLCVIEPDRLPHIAKFKLGFSRTVVPFYCITKKSFMFRAINYCLKTLTR